MKIFLKLEKTFILLLKIILFFLLTITFFGIFSYFFPQIKTINRTSVICISAFLISSHTAINLYGGFKIGENSTTDIKNAAILGMFFANIVTLITLHIMNISNINFYKFSEKYLKNISEKKVPSFSTFLAIYIKNNLLSSILILFLIFLIQILIIFIFAHVSNSIYFKFNKPKKTIVIYNTIKQLMPLVYKIKKNVFKWEIVDLVKYNNKKIFEKIQQNEAVFFADIPKKERSFIINYCYKHSKKIYIKPDVCDVIIHCSTQLNVDDSTIFATTKYELTFEQFVLKRILDIFISFLGLIITSPIILISAIAIKLYDKGPIIFKQKRFTFNKKEFYLLKFRSMVINADKKTTNTMAEKNDLRITPVGKILRRFRIDEIPQFLNILKGDLSIVGPRPERIEHVEKFEKKIPEFKYRLKVKAGLTGLAQIMGKYSTTPKDKLTLDLLYIRKYSLWLDLKIILYTLIVFLKPESSQGIQKIDQKTIKFITEKLKKNNDF